MPWANELCTSRGVGLYVANEVSVMLWARLTQPGGRAVINLEGSHSLADSMLTADTLDRSIACAQHGFSLVCGDIAQTPTQGTFGSDLASTRTGQLKDFVQGNVSSKPPVQAAGLLHLMGGSGGCTDVIRYMLDHPENVASAFLIAPMCGLEDIVTNWLNGGANGNVTAGPSGVTQSEVYKAYNGGVDDGGTAFRAALPTHDPLQADLTPLAGKSIKMIYSDDDPYVPVADVLAFRDRVNAVGGNAIALSQGNMGHSGLGVDPYDPATFFKAHP